MTDNEDGHAAIRVEELTKRFGRVVALDKVNLQVKSGAVFALLGPNGAGKSTLIDILCTIRRQDYGTAHVAGANVMRHPLQVRRNIGVVFQTPTVDTRLTVRENMEFHGLVYGMRRADRRRRIGEMLELVELSDWSDTIVRSLSGGMKRRLEVARALMHGPRILFMDEPTVGLDAQTRARIWVYLNRLRESQNLTIVVTTHYIEEVENCDHVCVIDHGRILADGTPGALKAEFGSAMVRAAPVSGDAATRIKEHYKEVVEGAEGRLLIRLDDAGGADTLIAEFGKDLRQIEIDQPSLESVFLSLTGRDLRETTPGNPGSGRR